ncbi:beta-galactosidase GalA [Novosphingobium lindaniclasticum]
MMDDQTISTDRRTAMALGLAGLGTASLPGIALAETTAQGRAEASPRRSVQLAEGWRFHLGHAADMAKDFDFGLNQRTYAKPGRDVSPATLADFDDSGWSAIRVPHDWAVDLPFAAPAAPAEKDKEDAVAAHGFKAIGRAFPQNSVGWYRCRLPVGAADKGRAVWLEFDGVFRNCKVFVNGFEAGGSASGYAPFRVDIADFLDYEGGANQLAVRVDASLGEGWFYEGAGIYRHVTLVSAAACHVPQWGTCVRAEVDGEGAAVTILTTLANDAESPAKVTVRHAVHDAEGRQVAMAADHLAEPGALGKVEFEQTARIRAPRLWSPASPYLYRLTTEVLRDGVVVDRTETAFGVRTVTFDAVRGFTINGQNVKLLGVCNHQDHAGVGAAIPDALHEWRVDRTLEMGANSWRSAHNPSAQVLLDICDRKGMMMIAETRLNTTNPEAMDELERMILSSRNHPSIILWSVGNEEGHQGSERGRRISAELVARCKALDPTRLTTQAMDQGWDGGAAEAVDVVGFNYRTDKIAAWHERHPDKPVIGTETGSTVSTRGAYENDEARHIVKAYDTEHPWWASTAEEWWTIVANAPYIAGGFIWTGFDYRGEPTPYPAFPSVASYFGAMDSCGFAKDNYFYYRAWWRPDQPLVHLLPHWNWAGREGQPVPVWAHGNCAEIELLLNGKSLGRKPMPRNGHLEWQVPYAPGKLEARGYNGGKVVARDQRVTASAPAKLKLTAERVRLAAGGADLSVLRVEVRDNAGNPVPTADNALRFSVSGPARIIGLGNGNPTSLEADKGDSRKAFNGLAQAIVQGSGSSGSARITVSGEGLSPAAIDLFFH